MKRERVRRNTASHFDSVC
uniref:Uncharacterized protein n=1 Tax=Anguilla anguilla TaxID=7936 RepID=A0A0E9SRH2_ANGAN